MRSLRPDQSDDLDNLRRSIAEGKRHVVMQAPTGYGKTVLSAELVNSARRKDKKVIFVVPAISLVDQTLELFAQQGIVDVGVIQANHHQTDGCAPVQIASVQSLQHRQMPQADVVLIDEVHKWFESYGKWLRSDWLNIPVIGLSATPWRKGLGNYFSRLLKGAGIQDLIDGGLLSDFKVFSPSHPDLEGVKTVGGDYHEGQLSDRMSKKRLVADIVETWLEHGRGRPTLCFAVDRAHAKKLQIQFEARGVKVGYQDNFTPDADYAEMEDDGHGGRRPTGRILDGRRSIKKKFHTGELEVVVNCETLTTGVDWDVRCIVLARPTKSEMLFVQIIGRGLRTANGKDHCLILDHSDNHLKLGFVTDIDAEHTELLKGEAKTAAVTDRIKLPKECPSCSFLKPPGTARCPACGFVAVKHSKIEPTAGELKELERKKKAAEEAAAAAAEDINAKIFYAELKGYGEQHGYHHGWARNKYKEKFGDWPEWSTNSVLSATIISARTLSWIRSRQIAWARSKYRT